MSAQSDLPAQRRWQALWKLLGTPGDERQVVLMYGNKSVEDILLKDELSAWSKKAAGRLKLVHVVGNGPDDPAPPGWADTPEYIAETGAPFTSFTGTQSHACPRYAPVQAGSTRLRSKSTVSHLRRTRCSLCAACRPCTTFSVRRPPRPGASNTCPSPSPAPRPSQHRLPSGARRTADREGNQGGLGAAPARLYRRYGRKDVISTPRSRTSRQNPLVRT